MSDNLWLSWEAGRDLSGPASWEKAKELWLSKCQLGSGVGVRSGVGRDQGGSSVGQAEPLLL